MTSSPPQVSGPPLPQRVYLSDASMYNNRFVRVSVLSDVPLHHLFWRCGYLDVLLSTLPHQIGELHLPLDSALSPALMASVLGAVYGHVPSIEVARSKLPEGAQILELSDSVMKCTEEEWGSPDHLGVVARPGVRRLLLAMACAEAWQAPDLHRPDARTVPNVKRLDALNSLSRVFATGELLEPWFTDFGRPGAPGRVYPADAAEIDWVEYGEI